MIILIIFLIIITILLIMPIKIVFTKDEKHNDIDIYLTKLFNLRLDFDEFLKLLLTTKENRDKITIKGLKHNYELLMLARHIIYGVSKNSRPEKLTLVLNLKKIYPEIDIFVYVVAQNVLNFLRSRVHEYVPNLQDEHFGIEFEDKYNFSFKWSIRLRAIYLIFSTIKNYKDIFKIIKFLRKGKKVYGTSSNL